MSNPYGNDPYGQQQPQNPYGGGGGQYGGGQYAAPGGGQQPAKTDGVSIASLVTSLICCAPVGFILGIVGLKRTKGGQRKGRGLAITGLVLGLVGLLAWVGIGIAAVAGVAWFQSIVEVDEAEAGVCVDIDDDDSNSVLMYEKECTEDHDGEIVGVAEVTDENLEQIESEMTAYCVTTVLSEEEVTKITEAGLDVFADLKALTEDPNDVEVGDHLVCYVESDDKLDEKIL
ncbi:hypothetical protein DJ010_18680 [Nocardioides silvaticus]|uniref:DUF4190 domain-containing protein n=1 Tax=Nocardioides silvaticus TaxID=2201891 RepID=A0A316TPC8_9ACTN|nr:DUF4190 domain-containing protein [Nocardioides silvaticus]PWN01566.1 hypothetical protein DJ010_18680 [Nocardioides silvaticus]